MVDSPSNSPNLSVNHYPDPMYKNFVVRTIMHCIVIRDQIVELQDYRTVKNDETLCELIGQARTVGESIVYEELHGEAPSAYINWIASPQEWMEKSKTYNLTTLGGCSQNAHVVHQMSTVMDYKELDMNAQSMGQSTQGATI